jgi:hypothetical protein
MRDALVETSTLSSIFEVDFPDMLSANRELFRSSASTATSCVTPRS